MELNEIKIGQRVRVPATEKFGGGSHYAKVTDIIQDAFTGEPLVLVFIPTTKQEKVLAIGNLQPDRKPKTILTKKAERTAGLGESPGDKY